MFLLTLQSIDIPIVTTTGIEARIPHSTNFVTFLDYDNIKDKRLIEELRYLQEYHELGDFHVFGTGEFARHAICIDLLRLREELDVMYNSTCDAVFKRGIRLSEQRTWVLRALEKGSKPQPKYLYSVESPYNGERMQSEAHAIFLKLHYGAKIRLVNPDGNKIIKRQRYKTSHGLDLSKDEKANEEKKT
jgi:hypothetical protein